MEPLPNELVMDAWKAKVGYSLDSERTQDAFGPVSTDIVCNHVNTAGFHCVYMKHY